MNAGPGRSSEDSASPTSGLEASGSRAAEQAKSEDIVRVELKQQQDYRFTVAFGGDVPPLNIDEPAPLGAGTGPSPLQLLAASVGSCLSDSLLFALRKFKQHPDPVTCSVEATHRTRSAHYTPLFSSKSIEAQSRGIMGIMLRKIRMIYALSGRSKTGNPQAHRRGSGA